MRRSRTLAALALAAVLVATGCSSAEESGGELSAQALATPWEAADVALTDTSGSEYSLGSDPDAALTLVFFGYSKCPDICQLVMSNIAGAMTRIGDDVDDVDVVFVTTDPARDTEAALRRYLDRYDPSFRGLTGSLEQLSEAAESFHVVFERGEKLPSGGYDITHGTQVFALGDDHKVRHYWSQDVTAQQLASDVKILLEQS